MTHLDGDPQTYLDADGNVRRKPGRPRKDPRGTQVELRAKSAQRARQVKSNRAAQIEEDKSFVRSGVDAIFDQHRDALQGLAVAMIDQLEVLCSKTNLTLSSDEIRAEAAAGLADVFRDSLTREAIIDYKARKLREEFEQFNAAKNLWMQQIQQFSGQEQPNSMPVSPAPASQLLNFQASPPPAPQPHPAPPAPVPAQAMPTPPESVSLDGQEVDIEALMEMGLPGDSE